MEENKEKNDELSNKDSKQTVYNIEETEKAQELKEIEKDKVLNKKINKRIIVAIIVIAFSIITLYYTVIRDYNERNNVESEPPYNGESSFGEREED